MIGQSEERMISRIFHPGDPFVACMLESRIVFGVIETDFQVLLNSLIESSIYEALACSSCLCRFQAPSTGKAAEETVVDLICCFTFLDHQPSTIFTQ